MTTYLEACRRNQSHPREIDEIIEELAQNGLLYPAICPQEFFDQLCVHLFDQGRKSQGANGCFYRVNVGHEILACGIGAFVPHNLYSNTMEGTSVRIRLGNEPLARNYHTIRRAIIGSPLRDLPAEMLTRAQHLHDDAVVLSDGAFDVISLTVALADFARAYDLDMAVLRSPRHRECVKRPFSSADVPAIQIPTITLRLQEEF